jgi:hypothetical protein
MPAVTCLGYRQEGFIIHVTVHVTDEAFGESILVALTTHCQWNKIM